MAKRERVQLAHKYDPKKHFISGWYMSEKLDGMRCYWDGGITRGMKKPDVPWANTAKDERYVSTQMATGLWSRLGNVIHAPEWWTARLPECPLDGELYVDRDTYRQDLLSAVHKIRPQNEEWRPVQLHCYGLPAYEIMFPTEIGFWLPRSTYRPSQTLTFRQEYYLLKQFVTEGMVAKVVHQEELPLNGKLAPQRMEEFAETVIKFGAEGIMLRDPNKSYECCRSYNLLKYKPFDDMEGTVVGYITGRETDKGSKLLGLMGAMVLRLDDGVRLELSGFTNRERELEGYHHQSTTRAKAWAEDNPETGCPEWIDGRHFKRGDRITFKYRGKSKDNVPNEARYWRKDDRV